MARTVAELAKRRKKVPELLGGVEVAAALGVVPPNLQHIKDLPEPVIYGRTGDAPPGAQRLACGRLWLAEEIREFAKVYQARRLEREQHTRAA